jgi:pyruvate-formate lyase-activating enzyme
MKTISIIFKSLYACKHQCGFCHVLHVPRNTSHMSTAEVKATFDVIERKYAGHRVDLDMSGGEFSMRKDAVEVMRYLRTKQIHLSSLVLDTMAVPLADESLAQSLGELFTKANVSVHADLASVHAEVSASKTEFEDLRAGLVNIFRYFPAVFTNTSINKFNWHRLREIAKFVLKARRDSGRDTPLHCAYYLPVYRLYGEAQKENSRRLQDVDNTQFLPPGERLDEVAVEFDRARDLLATHGAVAELRDFNYPACVYRRVTGTYPDNSFGLPNFISNAYFTDFEHPMQRGYTLEEVYPSMFGRVKDSACASCVAEPVCPGITAEWRKQGYAVKPIDEAEYAAAFPAVLLSKTLQSVFYEPGRMAEVLNGSSCDWSRIRDALFARLTAGVEDVRAARERVLSHTAEERARSLSEVLREQGSGDVAHVLDDELARLRRLEAEAVPESFSSEGAKRAVRLPLVS